MRPFMVSLLMGFGLALSAQTPPERWTWASEVDLLPVATGGGYASITAGRDRWRFRVVAAAVNIPKSFVPEGWEDARTRAQALLVDRYLRPGFVGPWVGGGLERWDENLRLERSLERVRLRSLQATLGAGWVFDLGRGFTLNPWVAVHQRIAGDRQAAAGQAICRPAPLQVEASVKVGYTFH